MKIIIGSDHAGYELKGKLKKYLIKLGYECEDVGANKFEPLDDYPDFVIPLAEKVANNLKDTRGVFLGGSGQGEAMLANKVKGIRAALYYGGTLDIIELSRTHNDANILSLGARFLSEAEAKKTIKLWLDIQFLGEEKHKRRIEKIKKYENV